MIETAGIAPVNTGYSIIHCIIIVIKIIVINKLIVSLLF